MDPNLLMYDLRRVFNTQPEVLHRLQSVVRRYEGTIVPICKTDAFRKVFVQQTLFDYGLLKQLTERELTADVDNTFKELWMKRPDIAISWYLAVKHLKRFKDNYDCESFCEAVTGGHVLVLTVSKKKDSATVDLDVFGGLIGVAKYVHIQSDRAMHYKLAYGLPNGAVVMCMPYSMLCDIDVSATEDPQNYLLIQRSVSAPQHDAAKRLNDFVHCK